MDNIISISNEILEMLSNNNSDLLIIKVKIENIKQIAEDDKYANDMIQKNDETEEEVIDKMKKKEHEIYEEIIRSISKDPLFDLGNYSGCKETIKSCVESIKTFSKAMDNNSRRNLYFAAQQGYFLFELKIKCKNNGKVFKKIIEKEKLGSVSNSNFLINFYNLLNKHNELLNSILPLSFYQKHFKLVRKVFPY